MSDKEHLADVIDAMINDKSAEADAALHAVAVNKIKNMMSEKCGSEHEEVKKDMKKDDMEEEEEDMKKDKKKAKVCKACGKAPCEC